MSTKIKCNLLVYFILHPARSALWDIKVGVTPIHTKDLGTAVFVETNLANCATADFWG